MDNNKMDERNINTIELLADYALYCLDRQRGMLTAYRKMRCEYWELAIIILVTLVAIGGAIASIVCAAMEIFDGWAAAIVFILASIATAFFVIYAKATSDSIAVKKAYIAEVSNVKAAVDDVAYLAEEVEQYYNTED